jgi:L-ascorbate metabolism protein UlaG (beta-lactamase superfamily)
MKEFSKIVFIFVILFLLNLCKGQDMKNKPSHHTESGFKNLDPSLKVNGFGDLISWQFSKLYTKSPSTNPDDYKFEIFKNDGSLLKDNKTKLSVTWIGHATTLVQIDGVNILTDPIWSERCAPVSFAGPKRFTPPGISLGDIPKIDIVIISHNHYDHLDLPSLRILEEKFKPVFFVGLKNKKFLNDEGLTNVEELDWWESREVKGLIINFTPTQHFSARGVLDRNATLWGSYVVQGQKNSFYFGGDTGYFSGFKTIGEKFPNIDIAILPIGAYDPRWFMHPIHMDPEESLQAFLDLKARFMIPMHYQTFVLTDEALDEPLKLITEIISKKEKREQLIDLKIGETRFF